MSVTKTLAPITKWQDRMAFDMALTLEGSGESIQEIQARYELDDIQLTLISKDKLFQQQVQHYREQIVSKGLTFRLKARAQAEELLMTSYDLIHAIDVPASVKADLIESTVKWAGLDAPASVGTDGNNGGVSITINLGNDQPTKIVDITPEEK